MIDLIEVSKSFGDVVALSRLSMSVKPGSITGFLGPNGAGKSTTLKLIMGEIKPDAGTVLVSEQNPFNNAKLKNKIGYVSEHEDLYPWMNGKQFVQSSARLYLPREQADTAAIEAIKRVGLKTSNKKIGSYSKGMKQRLKVAAGIFRRLARKPNIIRYWVWGKFSVIVSCTVRAPWSRHKGHVGMTVHCMSRENDETYNHKFHPRCDWICRICFPDHNRHIIAMYSRREVASEQLSGV